MSSCRGIKLDGDGLLGPLCGVAVKGQTATEGAPRRKAEFLVEEDRVVRSWPVEARGRGQPPTPSAD